MITATLLLVASRVIASRHSVTETIELADRVARRARNLRFLRADVEVEAVTRDISRKLERASRHLPGILCLHRAAAGRVWLASFGIEARIVVGVRRDASWQGHAWLEVTDAGDRIVIFTEEVPFVPVFGGHRD